MEQQQKMPGNVFSILSVVTTGNVRADRFSKDRARVPFQGKMAELIIYKRALAPAGVDSVENYLKENMHRLDKLKDQT